jgi:hypothetical protein
MLNWFRKNKKKSVQPKGPVSVVPMKPIDYPAKIILAWAKAVDGNQDILLWLKDNGYPELTMASYAILLKQEARDWLPKNGYPQLMAFIHAAEGNEKALRWLSLNGFELLRNMALAIDGEQEGWDYISTNGTADLFLLTQTIKKVKDRIEEQHNDVHSFGRD